MDVETWANRWIVDRYELEKYGSRRCRENYIAKVRQHLNAWIIPAIGTLHISDVSRNDCFSAMPGRERGAATKNRVLATLRAMLGDAVIEGILNVNPASSIRAYREEATLKSTVPAAKFPLILTSLSGSLSVPPLALMMFTGLRLGEALGLDWAQVDPHLRVLRFSPSQCKEGRAKVVPFPRELLPYLSPAAGGRVCPGANERTVRRHLTAACVDLNLPALTPHGIRHSVAQALLAAGADVPLISSQLGHSCTKTTERYLRSRPRAQQVLAIAGLGRSTTPRRGHLKLAVPL